MQCSNNKVARTGCQLMLLHAQIDELDEDRVAYLNLVDLAGSERQVAANTSGRRLKEGGLINKSLSALALVVSKLGEIAASRKAGRRKCALIV